jgi:hypothetical protein
MQSLPAEFVILELSCAMRHLGRFSIHLVSTRVSTAIPYPLPIIPKYPRPAGITIEGDNKRTRKEDIRRTAQDNCRDC